jgi:hypothetical protein
MRDALERSRILNLLQSDHVYLERPVRQTSTQEALRYARRICKESGALAG